ncbi:MAG: excinuclease ABC subunit UvrC [Elusimicrobiota bacterium]
MAANDKLEYLRQQLSNVPKKPGVYFFKDNTNKIIYIGKSKSLRSRLLSYFRETDYIKTMVMMANVRYIEFMATHGEREALLWEDKLIKKFRPKYNIDLKDSKTYPYLKLVNNPYPYLEITRKFVKDGSVYFGPYVDAGLLRRVKKLAEKLFLIRKCGKDITGRKYARPCLHGQMGRCLAPCVNQIDTKEYAKIVKDVKAFVSGRCASVVKKWKSQIKEYCKDLRFEEADIIKKNVEILDTLTRHDIRLWEINEGIINDMIKSVKNVEQGIDVVLGIAHTVHNIAGFDISNISGNYAVGSRVFFTDGKPNKDRYRKYKIRFTKETPNDVAMMREIIKRCIAGKDSDDIDLYLIDGGKGQVNAAYDEMNKYGKIVPVIGIAKKNEWLFKPGFNAPIILSKESGVLKLLQRVRDEAHRFAVAYHRKLRDKLA